MNNERLLDLGWQPFFQQQLSLSEWEQCTPARITDFQRDSFNALNENSGFNLSILSSMPAMTVGDWILLDSDGRFVRLLDRWSVFSRKAAGPGVATQLIATNVDTLFIVSSLNQDFSLNRIERYLALAHESGVEPVVILSKADLCQNPEDFVQQAQKLGGQLMVVAVNALNPASISMLSPWCRRGKTVALMGSSGVGKSTLVNTLLGRQVQRTAAIRVDDEEGRHTTSTRSLHQLPNGGLLLDMPGMRELQLGDCEQGIGSTFADIMELALRCKFYDCQHQTEPGCAIRVAIERGDLDERRLTSYQKLLREQAITSASGAEKRARGRAFGKLVRQARDVKNREK